MRERPILFSAPMVQALLAGAKTQTRRVVKHPLAIAAKQILSYKEQSEFDCILSDDTGGIIQCPYGKPGDQLWVRETFRDAREAGAGRVLYRASGDVACGWKPGIHMPRALARIILKVTAIRVERLQQISEADAKAEGAPSINYNEAYSIPYRMMAGGAFPLESHIYGYQNVWVDVNGGNADSWHSNPWVWVVEFKRVQS